MLGSLLQIRSQFDPLMKAADHVVRERTRRSERALAASPQLSLDLPTVQRQQELADVFVSRVTRKTWSRDRLIESLRDLESSALRDQDVGARLFYSDVERTIGLVTLLSQRYDVILMNPPYGDMPDAAKAYCKGTKKAPGPYTRTAQDFATAFLEQALDLLEPGGLVGMLVPRSFMHLSSFEAVRREILTQEARPELIFDLGRGILDRADVRVAAAVIRAGRGDHRETPVVFQRLAYFRDVLRHARFLQTFPGYVAKGPSTDREWYSARLSSFQDVPGMPYGYWASDSLRALFRTLPALDCDQHGALGLGRPNDKISSVMVGLQTSDDTRFVRCWWEVPEDKRGRGRRWVSFAKGGKDVHFYARSNLVVNWDDDGECYAGTGAVVRNRIHYFAAGFGWAMTAWRLRRFARHEADQIFGVKACVGIVVDHASADMLLAVANSAAGNALMVLMKPERDWPNGDVGKLPVPFPASARPIPQVQILVDLARRPHERDETFVRFVEPTLRAIGRTSVAPLNLQELLERASREEENRLAAHDAALVDLDAQVVELLGISDADRTVIDREVALRPRAEGGYTFDESRLLGLDASPDEAPDDEDDPDDDEEESDDDGPVDLDQNRDLVCRWLSYYVKQVIESDGDGVVPITAANREPALIFRVRAQMVADLGEAAATALEAQAPAYLGHATVADWLAAEKDGFYAWHVQAYQNRPIFWLLTSNEFSKRGKVLSTCRVFVHALTISRDTLPKVLSHFAEPLADHARTEWQRAQEDTSGPGVLAREAWLRTETALRSFCAALTATIRGPERAERPAATAKWLARTIAAVRGGQDLTPAVGYQPDVDFGVQVNLKPLVENKLVPVAKQTKAKPTTAKQTTAKRTTRKDA